jgi:hypothetical protein
MKELDLFKSEWTFARGLTLELLDSLTDTELTYALGPGLAAFWKQFRHVGRVQECYVEALNTKRIKFDYANERYRGGCSKERLRSYLQELDRELFDILESLDWNLNIEWDAKAVTVLQHLLWMVAHETLGHRQWIVYTRLMGKKLPPSWKAWGI